jgi:hypothetical protein
MVVSLPIDLSGHASLLALEEKGVRGRYVSVERLTELPDKKTRWEMATSSTPGGSIPMFLAERSMDKIVSDDVPGLLKYLKESPYKPTVAQVPADQSSATGTAATPAAAN